MKYEEKLEKQNEELKNKLKKLEFYVESMEESVYKKEEERRSTLTFISCLLAEEYLPSNSSSTYKSSRANEFVERIGRNFDYFLRKGILPNNRYIHDSRFRALAEAFERIFLTTKEDLEEEKTRYYQDWFEMVKNGKVKLPTSSLRKN